MAKRPALTEDSFLKHLFSPKRNPLPTGIRKRTLKVGPAARGYSKARVAAFNRMSPANQEMLKRSGLETSYLKGTGSLRDAKSALRGTAARKGYAKPAKTVSRPQPSTDLDRRVATHVISELRNAHYIVHPAKVHDRVPFMSEEDKRKAVKWKAGQIRAYASDGTKMVTIDDQTFNPLWYHV